MRKQHWPKRDPIKNYFPLPNEIFSLEMCIRDSLQAGGGSFPCDGWHACAAYDSNCGLCSIVLTP